MLKKITVVLLALLIAADCETMLDIVRVVKKYVTKEMNENNDH